MFYPGIPYPGAQNFSIPDPKIFPTRILDPDPNIFFYPGSRILHKKRDEHVLIVKKKIHPGSGSRIREKFIPDPGDKPGDKKAPDPGSRIWVRNTDLVNKKNVSNVIQVSCLPFPEG
jgi:hypothetical protein